MMRYSDGDAKTISTIKPDIDAYIDQYVAQVATGELNLEDSWDEYVATVGNMGGQSIFFSIQRSEQINFQRHTYSI